MITYFIFLLFISLTHPQAINNNTQSAEDLINDTRPDDNATINQSQNDNQTTQQSIVIPNNPPQLDLSTIQEHIIGNCRLTTDANMNYIKCQIQDFCISEFPSSGQQCNKFSYKQITDAQCVADCCPTQTIANISVEQCKSQYNRKYAIFIITTILSVAIPVGIFVGILATFLFGCQKNPYTGKRVFIGCCCCRRKYDFKPERQAIYGSDEHPGTDRPALPADDADVVNPQDPQSIMNKNAVVRIKGQF